MLCPNCHQAPNPMLVKWFLRYKQINKFSTQKLSLFAVFFFFFCVLNHDYQTNNSQNWHLHNAFINCYVESRFNRLFAISKSILKYQNLWTKTKVLRTIIQSPNDTISPKFTLKKYIMKWWTLNYFKVTLNYFKVWWTPNL